MFTRTLSFQIPKSSFFLFGPRQTGKSTILRELNADLYVDLLDPEEHLAFVKHPRLLIAAIECKHKQSVTRSDLSGLRSFGDSFPDVPRYVTTVDIHPRRVAFAEILPPHTLIERLLETG